MLRPAAADPDTCKRRLRVWTPTVKEGMGEKKKAKKSGGKDKSVKKSDGKGTSGKQSKSKGENREVGGSGSIKVRPAAAVQSITLTMAKPPVPQNQMGITYYYKGGKIQVTLTPPQLRR